MWEDNTHHQLVLNHAPAARRASLRPVLLPHRAMIVLLANTQARELRAVALAALEPTRVLEQVPVPTALLANTLVVVLPVV